MKREEEIEKESKRVSYNGDEFNSFIQGAEWADETMIEKMYKWLESNIDKHTMVLHSINGDELEEHIVLTKSFKESFMKAMEE